MKKRDDLHMILYISQGEYTLFKASIYYKLLNRIY